MNTLVLNLREPALYRKHIEAAAEALRRGELVAFPTETVYGLGVNRDNPMAVERVFEVKMRPEEKKLTLMIADREELKKYVGHISSAAQKLVDAFWPGPLAIVFPVSNGLDISMRFPDDAAARDLIRTAKVPVVTTSANLSGYPPATDAQQVFLDLGGKIPIILDGGSTRFRSPSTIVKVVDAHVEIIRHGIIAETSIRSCLANTMAKV